MDTSKYVLHGNEESDIVLSTTMEDSIKSLDKNSLFAEQLEAEVQHFLEQSKKPWGSVDKTKLPASCFLWVIDRAKRSTWKLPYREGAGGMDPKTGMYKTAGEVNLGALRAVAEAIAGARTGKPMDVPSAIKSKIRRLFKQYKIGNQMESLGTIPTQREFKEAITKQFADVKLDKENHKIMGVSILRKTSENCSFAKGSGRTYSDKAMQSVANLVEGKKAYMDHTTEKAMQDSRGVRSIKDLFGFYENGRLVDGIARADLVYLTNHATWVEPLVEQMSDKIGESIHAYGPSVYDKQTGREIVEDVTLLQSVDLVTEPGSTLNLFESGVAAEYNDEEVEIVELDSLTLEELKESRSDLVQSLTDDITARVKAEIVDADNTKALQESVSGLKAENKKLKEDLDVYQVKDAVAEREGKILAHIAESKIDEELVSEIFMQSLCEAKDEETVKKLIEDRKELMSAKSKKKGVKDMGDERIDDDDKGIKESGKTISKSPEGAELLEAVRGNE